MEVMSYTAFRAELAKTLDFVADNHKPVMITRQNGQHAVVMSLEDFSAYEETAYLMKSPKNRTRLQESLTQLEKGQSHARDLIE